MASINYFIQFLFLVSVSSICFHVNCNAQFNFSCIGKEREALLKFKEALSNPLDQLSSWIDETDCCRWQGIICENTGGNVLKVKLGGFGLGGQVSPSLLELKQLRYLDLSNNNFEGKPIPNFIGLLEKLIYLNLSNSVFGGVIPPNLGNLSRLQYLDLNTFFDESRKNDLHWLLGLSSLKYLHLGSVDLSKADDYWLQAINKLPSLSELHLPACGLSNFPLTLPFINFTSLSILDLSRNEFTSSLPSWLFKLSSLSYLDLNNNYLEDRVKDDFSNLNSLQYIDLSSNPFIGGTLPRSLGKLCGLKSLDLSFNNISGELTEFFHGFSSCANSSLELLDLGYNQLSGFLPDTLGNLKNLKFLMLEQNSFLGSIPNTIGNLLAMEKVFIANMKMNGTIPESIGQLSRMTILDLSENSWTGVVTEAHFFNLSSLKELSITKSSPKISLGFNVNTTWIPPFKLKYLNLKSCRVGPKFPQWLRNQNEMETIIMNTVMIWDNVPNWFWELDLQISQLDLSNNQLSGRMPNSLRYLEDSSVDLSSNRFEGPFPLFPNNITGLYLKDNLFYGPIPQDIWKKMSKLQNFDISYNSFNGHIPMSMGEIMGALSIFVASNNRLKGSIPPIWNDKPGLYILDLSDNLLTGEIPSSIGIRNYLTFLILSNNNLSGNIPSSLRNCGKMKSLDLGNNKLSGKIPPWIGELMPDLFILRLRSNLFSGDIPSQLCNISSLHILDLAHNNLSKSIPSCLGNLSGMTSALNDVRYEGQLLVATKGRELQYNNTLYLVNIIDLSGNNLEGHIPKELTKLSRLGTLNLSINQLTGRLPENIGNLERLETLDLSRNQLSGPIPPSMISLVSLNHLNLSYNNLSGRIPTSNQFQTFTDPSIYGSNPALCGAPLTKNCTSNNETVPSTDVDTEENEGLPEMMWFYISMGLGFVVGFWGVCGSLIIIKSWRDAYFGFVDGVNERVLPFVSLNVARLQRKLK